MAESSLAEDAIRTLQEKAEMLIAQQNQLPKVAPASPDKNFKTGKPNN